VGREGHPKALAGYKYVETSRNVWVGRRTIKPALPIKKNDQ
jgi:hypothetical protein